MRNVSLLLVALAAVALEIGWCLRRRRTYPWKAARNTIVLVVGQVLSRPPALLIARPALEWGYRNRLADFAPHSPLDWFAAFLAVEFCYYWFHRASHAIPWLWATHGVHHSSEQLTLLSALRLGWTGAISGVWAFFLPLVLVGVPPDSVVFLMALNLFYQFWLHTEMVPAMPVLERVLNTPALHRVHHAVNAPYRHKNFGGVLIVFDRLFGTYCGLRPEEPCRYGRIGRPEPDNPLAIALGGWAELFSAMRRRPSLAAGLRHAFLPVPRKALAGDQKNR